MKFNEDARVKIPTILHLMKLGYSYLSLKGQQWDESTNIFTAIFQENVLRLNPELNESDALRIYLNEFYPHYLYLYAPKTALAIVAICAGSDFVSS